MKLKSSSSLILALTIAMTHIGCIRDPTSCSENSECFAMETCSAGECVEGEAADVCGGCMEEYVCEPVSKLCVKEDSIPDSPMGPQ